MSNRISIVALLCAGIVSVTGCIKSPPGAEDPKTRLNDYISRSFGARSDEDRKAMLSYLTGDAKSRLASWSPDQFKEAFIDSKRQFLKLVFREVKSISPNEVSVTYELSYLDQKKGRDTKVTNKKLAQMIKEQEKWYVSDVHNIKELIEYQNEIALP